MLLLCAEKYDSENPTGNIRLKTATYSPILTSWINSHIHLTIPVEPEMFPDFTKLLEQNEQLKEFYTLAKESTELSDWANREMRQEDGLKNTSFYH